MQQSLTDITTSEEYWAGRANRPMLMKRPQFYFMVALVVLDLASTWLAYYVAHQILALNPAIQIGPFWEFARLPLIHSVLLVILFFSQRMYQRRRPISHLDELIKIVVYNLLAGLLTVALVTLASRSFVFHRSFVAYALGINFLIVGAARTIHAQIQWQAQARGIGDDRVLVVGAGDIGYLMLQKILQNPKLGYQVVGVVDNSSQQHPMRLLGIPVLGTFVDIPSIIERFEVDEVMIGLPDSNSDELVNIISLCEREKVGIRIFPDVFQIMASGISIGDLGGLPLLTVRDVALQGWKLTLKRGMDILLSAIALIFTSPIIIIAAILVKLDSPGPVFFTQERMGLDARPFKILKLRSMRKNSEEDGPGWTVPDDPRKTKLGIFMRRWNIDELPQLVNILIGDMSLVGPRPEQPVYVEQFCQSIPRYMDRHREKAGLTGWAQVNGLRGDTSIAERTKYDLWYIENWSLLLDLKILIRTAIQWILGINKNAY